VGPPLFFSPGDSRHGHPVPTLGENKANVKPVFSFALLSPLSFRGTSEMIYRLSMGSSAKRSASVTAAAVVAISGSLFLLLCCSVALLALLMIKLPGPAYELPPSLRYMMFATQGFMMCLSLFGVATGIGLIYLRNWARISVLIWGGLSVFFGVIEIPIAYLILLSSNPSAPALPVESMQAVRGISLVIDVTPFVIGVWWLILFNSKSVKAQFAGARASTDPGLPQKPSCPLPIAVLAWFYIASVLNLLFLPLLPFHVPVFVFGYVPPGSAGRTVLIVTSLAFAIAGIGLLKLKPWSYSLTIGLQLFWLASTVVSVLTPSYSAVVDSYMKEVQASFHLLETHSSPFNFAQHFGWILVASVVFAAAILGLFVCYRPRFLEAASRAAPGS
jgi:hypothetical protein